MAENELSPTGENELPKAYEASKFEDEIYRKWEESGKFNPDNYDLPDSAENFSIIMPPPNVTGTLHLGHASTMVYEDLMVRYNRMLGKRTLWLPGVDHAAIATQTKVEKELFDKEGKTRHDLGRESFLSRVHAFAFESRQTIEKQVRKMGASCDWSRDKYTLDNDVSMSVRELFIRMYNDGLIYRGDRIVNWCPKDLTTLSDVEVEYETQSAKLYTFKYSQDFPIAISTTRPETKLADTGVAVHPSDERYKEFVGKTYDVDFAGGVKLKIKVFADHRVDREFGTGAVGVTPAHSMADWQFAEEHDLPIIKLIKEDATINENGGSFAGLSVTEARKKVVEWLKENNLLTEEKDLGHNVGVCSRCGTGVEQLPSLQWFINVNKEVKFPDGKTESIKERTARVVREGQINIIPERFNKAYFDWVDNLRDWCISRQIWFGHRIPVWYKGEEVHVGHEQPLGDGWVMDSDTLDTWFSSGMWTFSTLGWPTNQKREKIPKKYSEQNDLERFHPTVVLETGYDILTFWVVRMVMMTEYALGEVPFQNVYLHGLIRDEKGRKMSKSLGNGIDPLEIIPKYGTDALRLSLVIGSTPGNDTRMSESKVEGYRNFVNKLYNISRYIITTVGKVERVEKVKAKTLADEWILNEMARTTLSVTEKINNYQFSAAGEELRDFTWNYLADWYLEIAKIEGGKNEILLYLLENVLKLWHPFMPFVTEHIWENFQTGNFLMEQSWPQTPKKIKEVDFDRIQKIISALRNLRAENKIEPVLKLNALIVAEDKKLVDSQSEIIKRLGRLEQLEISKKLEVRPKVSAVAVMDSGDSVYLLLEGIIDPEKEKARLVKEIAGAEKEITGVNGKLSNKSFVDNAPKEIVETEKRRAEELNEKITKLKSQLESLQ